MMTYISCGKGEAHFCQRLDALANEQNWMLISFATVWKRPTIAVPLGQAPSEEAELSYLCVFVREKGNSPEPSAN